VGRADRAGATGSRARTAVLEAIAKAADLARVARLEAVHKAVEEGVRRSIDRARAFREDPELVLHEDVLVHRGRPTFDRERLADVRRRVSIGIVAGDVGGAFQHVYRLARRVEAIET